MTVQKYKRKESPTEFLKELYEMNTRCGQMIMKKPNKYRANYGDFLIKQCLKALACAQEANAIYAGHYDTYHTVRNMDKLLMNSSHGKEQNVRQQGQSRNHEND